MATKVFSNIIKSQCNSRFLFATNTTKIKFSNVSSSPRKSYAKTEAKKIRFYVLHRYAEYIKNYDKILEKRFPSATQVFRIFMVGVKDFYNDVKEYMKIIRILNTSGKGFTSLTRKEIELYHQMPKDMMKVGPVLLISALPFANYVIFPLAYLFPRHLLTSHFWNLQQKSEFTVLWLKDRLMHNRPVFRHLQEPLKTLKCHELYEPWKKILGMLGSGVQPSVEEILECAELFADKPYSIPYLKRSHVKELLQMHDMRVGIFRRRARLRHRAKILREMDRAVIREGGVHNLPTDALRMACFIRGLNPSNLGNDELIRWLTKWMAVSKEVTDDNLSLLLHSPILLGYNEQSNWSLIYTAKKQ